jgi:hypothetical protein
MGTSSSIDAVSASGLLEGFQGQRRIGLDVTAIPIDSTWREIVVGQEASMVACPQTAQSHIGAIPVVPDVEYVGSLAARCMPVRKGILQRRVDTYGRGDAWERKVRSPKRQEQGVKRLFEHNGRRGHPQEPPL